LARSEEKDASSPLHCTIPLAEGVRRFEVDQAKRLKELEKENGKLKRLVAELALDKQILKDIAEGNF
jgi:hypothetical protein